MPMAVGLRAPFYAGRLLLPGPITWLLYAALAVVFAVGAVRTWRRSISILYLTVAVFPWLYAISPLTLNSGEPRYVVILTPVIALLLAQVATSFPRAVAVLAIAFAVTAVTLHRMDVVRPFRAGRLPGRPARSRPADRDPGPPRASTGSTPTTGSRTGSTSTRTSASSQ